MNWIDESIEKLENDWRQKGGKDLSFNNFFIDDIRTALQEAHTKGYEEGRLAEIEANAVSDIQIAKEKAEQLKAQGTQEALAKVEEWAKDRLTADDTHIDDLLHHLQQLKD